ncbi:MAG: ASCH domain-containing protein [Marinisporobacter sp.]|jgi:uncharacterized protein YhfF|nr:ASCH domain-containing protein [Marinisporobacter sp.]
MEQKHHSVKEMWRNYLISIGEDIIHTDKNYISWHFCDNEKDANDLAQLVKQNVKRATTGLHYSYEIDGEELPKVGDLNIITDWHGMAQCIVETTKVTILPFNKVTEELAQIEGEGDQSLKYWQEAHRSAFSRRLKEYDMEFREDTLVVFEEFEIVYK